jgi:rubrerythrin
VSAPPSDLAAIRVHGFTRGAFLARGVLAAGALYGAGAAGPALTRALGHAKHGAFGGGDIGIANFALGLERIEKQFYETALGFGLRRETKELFEAIAANEDEHEKALIQVIEQLGGKPAPAEKVELTGLGDDENVAVDFAIRLEETSVRAYNGAVSQLESRDLMLALSSIAQAEGRHAGAVREHAGELPAPESFERVLSGEQADSAVHELTRG